MRATGLAVVCILSCCYAGTARTAESVVGSGGMILVTGAELKASGQPLKEEELAALIRPGTSVVRVVDGGFVQRWTHNADGTLIARTTTGAAFGYSSYNDTTGPGKWALHNGEYCGRIDWTHKLLNILGTEKWCHGIYRMDGRLFLAPVPIVPTSEGNKFGEIQFRI